MLQENSGFLGLAYDLEQNSTKHALLIDAKIQNAVIWADNLRNYRYHEDVEMQICKVLAKSENDSNELCT